MITAFASTETAVEALRLGAHDYLSKPFEVDELKSRVRKALEQRQLQQENLLLKRDAAAPRTSSATSSAAARRCWRSSS